MRFFGFLWDSLWWDGNFGILLGFFKDFLWDSLRIWWILLGISFKILERFFKIVSCRRRPRHIDRCHYLLIAGSQDRRIAGSQVAPFSIKVEYFNSNCIIFKNSENPPQDFIIFCGILWDSLGFFGIFQDLVGFCWDLIEF